MLINFCHRTTYNNNFNWQSGLEIHDVSTIFLFFLFRSTVCSVNVYSYIFHAIASLGLECMLVKKPHPLTLYIQLLSPYLVRTPMKTMFNNICFLFIPAAIAIIGVFIWLAYIPSNFYVAWSCGMVIIAAILATIAGLLLIPELGWCSSYSNSGYYSSNICLGVCGGAGGAGGGCCDCDCQCCEDEPRRRTPPSPSPPPTRKELRSEAVVRQPARWVYTGSTIGYPPSTRGISSAYPPSSALNGFPPSTGMTSLSGRPTPFSTRGITPIM